MNTTLVALKMEISMQHSGYLSQISLLPMLLLVRIFFDQDLLACKIESVKQNLLMDFRHQITSLWRSPQICSGSEVTSILEIFN